MMTDYSLPASKAVSLSLLFNCQFNNLIANRLAIFAIGLYEHKVCGIH